jgi:hypothetical protein
MQLVVVASRCQGHSFVKHDPKRTRISFEWPSGRFRIAFESPLRALARLLDQEHKLLPNNVDFVIVELIRAYVFNVDRLHCCLAVVRSKLHGLEMNCLWLCYAYCNSYFVERFLALNSFFSCSRAPRGAGFSINAAKTHDAFYVLQQWHRPPSTPATYHPSLGISQIRLFS